MPTPSCVTTRPVYEDQPAAYQVNSPPSRQCPLIKHERASSAHASREECGLATVFPCDEKRLAHRRSVNAQAIGLGIHGVELLSAYSHSMQAADRGFAYGKPWT
jgi:hypothetical protein